MTDNTDLIAVQRAVTAHPQQLIDTWGQHQADKARIASLERELADMTAELAYANLRATVAIQTSNQLIDAEVDRRKAEAIAAGAAYARHRAEALRIIDMGAGVTVPSLVCTCREDSVAGRGFGLCPVCYPQHEPFPDTDYPPAKPAFPARALAPRHRDGWVMVR